MIESCFSLRDRREQSFSCFKIFMYTPFHLHFAAYFSIFLTLSKKYLDMPIAKITSKGQITIPKKVREELHLKSGDKVSIETEGGSARILPSRVSILDRAGVLKTPNRKPKTLKEMDEAIAQGISEKNERS